MHIAADIVDVNPDFNILQSLYHLVEPTCVLVSSQVPDSFISVLKSLTGTDSPSESASCSKNILPERKLNILPRKDYSKLPVSGYLLNCNPKPSVDLRMVVTFLYDGSSWFVLGVYNLPSNRHAKPTIYLKNM